MFKFKSVAFLCAIVVSTAFAEDASDRYYQAIRNNDLASVRSLLKASDVNLKDQRGGTPLMYAAAYGSIEAMNMLLEAGADVSAKNAFDVTALHWCSGDLAKVRLLVSKGADVNARSKQGRTPLLIAAAHDGAFEIVKLLIEKGADISAKDFGGSTALLLATDANDTNTISLLLEKGADANARTGLSPINFAGQTPLMNAAGHGNVEAIKMLLAKGADVNASNAKDGPTVKNGPIALASLTPLLQSVAYAGPEAVKLLLAAGAQVNAQDVRGMTPLMLAIASDHPDVRVVRLLLEQGADPNIRSKDGETAIDWAKKFANPPVLDALKIDRKQGAAMPAVLPAAGRKLVTPKEAAQRSVALLQKTGNSFFTTGGCVSCHAQNLTGIAVTTARASGLIVDEAAAAAQLKSVKLQWASFDQVLLQRMDPPGAMDTIMYSMLQLANDGIPADRVTDAMVHNVAGEQRKEGNWHFGLTARPPMEDGDFSRTAICIRALAVYGPPGRKAEFDQRIARAAAWLKATKARTTEDRTMQLLGLKWANADRRALEAPLKQLIALQRADGGWAQTPELGSDAYATGLTLATLHELGVMPSEAAYQRGVAYLLRTQLDDGSWHVVSRAPKFQPYFQSGFPHDHDQWISASATAWSAIALMHAISEKPATAVLR